MDKIPFLFLLFFVIYGAKLSQRKLQWKQSALLCTPAASRICWIFIRRLTALSRAHSEGQGQFNQYLAERISSRSPELDSGEVKRPPAGSDSRSKTSVTQGGVLGRDADSLPSLAAVRLTCASENTYLLHLTCGDPRLRLHALSCESEKKKRKRKKKGFMDPKSICLSFWAKIKSILVSALNQKIDSHAQKITRGSASVSFSLFFFPDWFSLVLHMGLMPGRGGNKLYLSVWHFVFVRVDRAVIPAFLCILTMEPPSLVIQFWSCVKALHQSSRVKRYENYRLPLQPLHLVRGLWILRKSARLYVVIKPKQRI